MSECVWGTCCGQLTLSMKFSLTKDRNLELRALENSAFTEKKKRNSQDSAFTHPSVWQQEDHFAHHLLVAVQRHGASPQQREEHAWGRKKGMKLQQEGLEGGEVGQEEEEQ